MENRKAFHTAEFRVRETDNHKFLDAYFIKFNDETQLGDNLFEEIAPESIDRSLNDGDIRCLFNHDDGFVLGRTGNNTLTLTKDDQGLYGSVRINEEDSQAMAVYSRVRRGDINACSFGFVPTQQDYEEREDGVKVTVRDMDLIEVSIVTFPAYPSTEAHARKKDVEAYRKQKLNVDKNRLKERLKHV